MVIAFNPKRNRFLPRSGYSSMHVLHGTDFLTTGVSFGSVYEQENLNDALVQSMLLALAIGTS